MPKPLYLYSAFVILSVAVLLAAPRGKDYGDYFSGKALNLLQGKGLSDPSKPWFGAQAGEYSLALFWARHNLHFGTIHPDMPTAFWMPGYSIWLAFWFKLLGYESFWVQLVQILVMGLTIPLTVYLGKCLFGDPRLGLGAGLILVFHPYLLRFPHTFPSENLFIPLFIGGLACWYWYQESPGLGKVVVFSLLWALAGLTREAGIIPGVIGALLLYSTKPRQPRRILLSVGIFALLWGAWIGRNAVVLGEARLFPSKTGFLLWDVNNRTYLDKLLKAKNPNLHYPFFYFAPPENEAYLVDQFGFSRSEVETLRRYDYPPDLTGANENAIDHTLRVRFVNFFRDHPGIVLAYAGERLLVSFGEDILENSLRQTGILFALYFSLLYALALYGLVISWNLLRRHPLLVVACLFFLISVAAGPPNPRYRVPFDPILALFASAGVFSLIGIMRRKLGRPPLLPA